jgi:hypothetical protein
MLTGSLPNPAFMEPKEEKEKPNLVNTVLLFPYQTKSIQGQLICRGE